MPDVAISCRNVLNCNIVPGDRHSSVGLRDDTVIESVCNGMWQALTLTSADEMPARHPAGSVPAIPPKSRISALGGGICEIAG